MAKCSRSQWASCCCCFSLSTISGQPTTWNLQGTRHLPHALTWSWNFSREIFFLPQPSQVKGNLGQTSWCAFKSAQQQGARQCLQLRLLSGHSCSEWCSFSPRRTRPLQAGHSVSMNGQCPSWQLSYSLRVPFQVQPLLGQTAGRLSTSLRAALSGKAELLSKIECLLHICPREHRRHSSEAQSSRCCSGSKSSSGGHTGPGRSAQDIPTG